MGSLSLRIGLGADSLYSRSSGNDSPVAVRAILMLRECLEIDTIPLKVPSHYIMRSGILYELWLQIP